MKEITMTNEEALMYIDGLRMAYICDPQECGKKDGYNKDDENCQSCDKHYDALAIATLAIEKQIPKKPVYKMSWADRRCPECGQLLNYTGYPCRCGQAIDWSDEDDE